jgi:outer membrane protein OmpA-like peptidoglycan-associated protein
MNMKSLLAVCFIAAALPAIGQEGPVIGEGKAEMGTLVDALAPKTPIRTRGIGLARDQPSTPPVAAAPAKVSLMITFEPNSAVLTAGSRQSVEVLGQALASEKLLPFRFAVEGHADPRGIPAANLKLSQLRAESVRAYLVNTMRIDGARLDAIGKGDRELMNKAVPEAPENRRVTIVNLSR